MPPAISDDEMSDAGASFAAPSPPSAKATSRSRRTSAAPKKADSDVEVDTEDEKKPIVSDVNGGDEDDEDDEELDEDEFVVEKILSHVVQDGKIKYKVKWEGYEKKADQTWEDEDNLQENATEILSEYLDSIGGRDRIFEETAKAKKSKKRGRSTAVSTPANGKRSKRGSHPGSETPPASAGAAAKKSWKPPAGSWEEHVASIDACHDENTGKLVVYLTWKNGNKTQHGTEAIYTRCPQQMLRFYERHVKIVKTTSDHDAETAAAEAAAEQSKGDEA